MSYYSGGQRRRPGGQGYNNRGYSDSTKKFDNLGGRKFGQRSTYASRSDTGAHSNSSQVWMGDLDPNWDESDILKLWRDVGMNPINVKIMRDRYNDSSRPMFCFVTFNSSEEALNALQKNGTSVPGTSKAFKLSHATGAQHSDGTKKKFDDFSIFVGDLDPEMKETQLFDLFNVKYPNAVRQVKIMMDPTSNTSKGYGFVRFTSSVTQQTALRDKEVMHKGKIIKVGPTAGSNGTPTFTKEASVLDVSYEHIQLAQSQPPMNHFTDPENTWIKVQGLAGRFTREMLLAHFGSFGMIVSCVLDSEFNQCHIRYLLRTQAETAIVLMSNVLINGCILEVNWAPSHDDGTHTIKMNKDGSLLQAPVIYGSGLQNIEGLNRAQAVAVFSQTYEESEPNQQRIDAQYIHEQLDVLRLMT